ncbi:hypothetical protein ACTG16_22780 [Aeromonas sp. 23P]|uniref:hypothetical protein n=1 Tax=Aeromonas sp. 23P TaxID=3452716 RepID=UPI003F7A9F0A|nr:hypothetical protein [Aeromonas veronii]
MQQKQATPMKRLCNHFRIMESMRPQMEKPTTLQGSEPRGNTYLFMGSRKGVLNDFTRIYKLQPYRSLGFVFNYLKVQTATVSVTLKVQGQMSSSRNFTEDEFRILMNGFNNALRNTRARASGLSDDDFEALVVEHFLSGNNNIEAHDMAAEIEDITRECESIWANASGVINDKETLQRKEQRKADRLREKVRTLVDESPEGRRLAEVKAQIILLMQEEESLKKATRLLTDVLSNKHGVSDSVNEVKRIKEEVEQTRDDATAKIEERMVMLPSHLKQAIRAKLK